MQQTESHVEYTWEAEQDEPPSLGLIPFSQAILEKMGSADHAVSILFTHDEAIRQLNAEYRHKDSATDVLSFPAVPHGIPDLPPSLGDIVISVDTAEQQALDIGQPLTHEIRFLVLHGLLHLMGYDHETDNGEMLELQNQLKSELALYFKQES
jgi:probable rRNA maturation factor